MYMCVYWMLKVDKHRDRKWENDESSFGSLWFVSRWRSGHTERASEVSTCFVRLCSCWWRLSGLEACVELALQRMPISFFKDRCGGRYAGHYKDSSHAQLTSYKEVRKAVFNLVKQGEVSCANKEATWATFQGHLAKANYETFGGYWS